jgi:hypothetical protein
MEAIEGHLRGLLLFQGVTGKKREDAFEDPQTRTGKFHQRFESVSQTNSTSHNHRSIQEMQSRRFY